MTLNQLSIYMFTLLINITILIHMSRRENVYKGSYNYFKTIVVATAVLTVFEMCSWVFDGVSGDFPRLFNFWSNQLLLTFSAVPLTTWFVYLDYRVYDSLERRKKRFKFYGSVNILIFAIMTANLFGPYVFTINEMNQFVRGNATLVFGYLQFFYLLVYMILAYRDRKLIEDRLLRIIVMVIVFPFVGTVLQGLNLGTVFIWPMLTYVVLAAFLFVERDEMMKDTLTGLAMRGQLENRLKSKIARGHEFVLVMIDLDDFKSINDQYGHNEGDKVLRLFSKMLMESVHLKDFVYRYAGDEFIVFIDKSDMTIVQKVLMRLDEKVSVFNSSNKYEYKLKYSYGVYAVDRQSMIPLTEILANVDQLMYENKRKSKELIRAQT